MSRNADNEQHGANQPVCYARRRAAVLAAGLSLLALPGLLGWAFSGGGKTASPAPGNPRAADTAPAAAYRGAPASPSGKAGTTVRGLASPASPSGAAPEAAGRCPPGAVVLSLFTSRPSYPRGQDPEFDLYAVSTAPGACTVDLSPGKLHLTVMSAGRVIWDSAGCARSDATRVVQLSRGVPAQRAITWNRTLIRPGCVKAAWSARPGTYEVQARTIAVASQLRAFTLR
jgi:hypothetical protein